MVLKKFEWGNIWESYSKQLGQYFTENSIAEDNKVAVLLTVLSPPVYEILRDSCHPELPQHKTYAQLSKFLERHCSQQALVFKERIKFHEAKQADNENVCEWLARITNLAVFCEFEQQHDIMLRDKFVLGLADQRIANRLYEDNRKERLIMKHMVDVAVEMDSSMKKQDQMKLKTMKQQEQQNKMSNANILDFSDEILIKIILNLNARERVPVGNSCLRFNRLVFMDGKVLRDLDFSEEGRLTLMSDIRQYFHNENTCKLIRRVNMGNVVCMRPGELLNETVGKAVNLVAIHIHGVPFKDIWQLGSFLNPLLHVKRLSIDWHLLGKNDFSLCRKLLQMSFGKLEFFSVNLKSIDLVREFLLALQLCQKLKELHMEVRQSYSMDASDLGNKKLSQLKNLEMFKFRGPESGRWGPDIKKRFVTMLPNPEEWMDLELSHSCSTICYLEKNLEVCTELAGGKWMANVPNANWSDYNLGWALSPECLIHEVLKITHDNVPEQFCSFSRVQYEERCLLNIEDAKMLVKNPRHQISSLFINHDIERGCDMHLIASAFPDIITLRLSCIASHDVATENEPHSERCLRKRGSAVPEQRSARPNFDSSFKMLVDHMPHVKHLTIDASVLEDHHMRWDLDALYLIPSWKNLETLWLEYIPIEHGDFLIEIGKQCKALRKLTLSRLGPVAIDDDDDCAWCYRDGLSQMLPHCQNLREFSMEAEEMGAISEVFIWLSYIPRLRRVSIETDAVNDTIVKLVSSIEHLIRRCCELNTFVIRKIDYTTSSDYEELKSAVERWTSEYSHRKLQIQVTLFHRRPKYKALTIGTNHEDTPTPQSYSSYVDRRPNFP